MGIMGLSFGCCEAASVAESTTFTAAEEETIQRGVDILKSEPELVDAIIAAGRRAGERQQHDYLRSVNWFPHHRTPF